MLNITVTVTAIQEKEEEEILIEIIRTTTILTVIPIIILTTIKIIIMDITTQTHITTMDHHMDHLMVIITDMEKSKLKVEEVKSSKRSIGSYKKSLIN